jgi:hypothetical protein
MARNLIDILEELGDYIERSETPRETVLIALGFAIGQALRSGWTGRELVALNLWPKPPESARGRPHFRTLGETCTECAAAPGVICRKHGPS